MYGYRVRTEVSWAAISLLDFPSQSTEYFDFSRGQTGVRSPFEVSSRKLLIEHGLATHHCDITEPNSRSSAFFRTYPRAPASSLPHPGFLRVHGQHQNQCLRRELQDFPRGLQAIISGKAQSITMTRGFN